MKENLNKPSKIAYMSACVLNDPDSKSEIIRNAQIKIDDKIVDLFLFRQDACGDSLDAASEALLRKMIKNCIAVVAKNQSDDESNDYTYEDRLEFYFNKYLKK